MDGWGIGAAALSSAWDDACVGTEGVEGMQLRGVTEFSSDARGEDKSDAWDAGKHGVRGGDEDEGGFVFEFLGVAVKALVEVDGSSEGTLEGVDAFGLRREGFVSEFEEFGGGFFGVFGKMIAKGFGEGEMATTCDFWGAEAVSHEME